jgi:hypothetical protein
LIAMMTMGLLAAGCGAGTSIIHTSTRQPVTGTLTSPATPAPPVNPDAPVPTPGPTGVRASPMDVAVIRAWSDALRRGDVGTAARYFALPSVMINGIGSGGAAVVITIDTLVEAEAANATLPCGARFISADQRGRYVNALFRLTGRPGLGGSTCGGGGGLTARTNFVIARGRIVEWVRAPDDPGDNGTPRAPAPAPGSQSAGPNV